MRIPLLLLIALLTSGSMLHAQTTPQTTSAPAASSAELDGYLKRWEEKMRDIKSLTALLARIDKDKSFNTVTKYQGTAQYMKAGSGTSVLNLAHLELKQEGKSDFTEKFISTGTYLYQFLPGPKEIRAYEMPKPKPGQVADDNFLTFLFGMKAEEARRRYVLALYKVDQYYIYIDVAPRFPADRADFTRARLVLNKDTFLPRQLWFEHPNGNEITWDIPRLQADVTLDRRLFDAPRTPPGWKLVPVSRATSAASPAPAAAGDPPPRVVRPSR